jgi:hypothetical protein
MAVYIKSENGVLTVFLFFVASTVLGTLYPPIFGEMVSLAVAVLVTYMVYEMMRSQT